MGNSIQDDLFGEDTQSPEGTATPARSGARRYMAPVTLGGAALLVLLGVGAVAFTGLSGSSETRTGCHGQRPTGVGRANGESALTHDYRPQPKRL